MDETSRDKELHERLITVPWMMGNDLCSACHCAGLGPMEGQRCVSNERRVVGEGEWYGGKRKVQ